MRKYLVKSKLQNKNLAKIRLMIFNLKLYKSFLTTNNPNSPIDSCGYWSVRVHAEKTESQFDNETGPELKEIWKTNKLTEQTYLAKD